MAGERHHGGGPEPNTVAVTPVVVTVVALVLLLAVAMVVLLPWRSGPGDPAPADIASGPALLDRPAAALEAHRAAKERRLQAYGWVDREAGITHIPVERAMAILRQRDAGNPGGKP